MKYLKKSLVIFVFIIIIFNERYTFSQPNARNILYILDASGSMYGFMENRTKFDLAREVLIESIMSLPSDVGVGLLYFGNNIKGRDCIRFPVTVGVGNRGKILEEIRGLQPGGLTPLAHSLTLGAEVLARQGIRATFVLITDGKEECGGNPIKTVKELAEKGAMIEIHIIGLNISEETKDELQEIASVGKGYFYNVKNAKDMRESLKEVTSSSLGEQILRLIAAAGVVKFSRNLYTIGKGEVLRIKFRPASTPKPDTDSRSVIFFCIGDVQIELEYIGGDWILFKCEGDRIQQLGKPTGFKINNGKWNEFSINTTSNQHIISFNKNETCIIDKQDEKTLFRVGVEGFESSFKELTTRIPLY